MNEPETRIGTSLVVLGLLILVLVAINSLFLFEKPTVNGGSRLEGLSTFSSTQSAYILPQSEPSYIPILDTSVQKPDFQSKSMAAYDIRSGRFLYSKDSRLRLPIASLTKIMSAVIVIENLDRGQIVNISDRSIRVDGEKQTLYINENISVESLLKMMLIESSNDAAYALANYAADQGLDLVNEMNKKATELGMYDPNFLDPAGLNDLGYSTAEDLVRLTHYALRYKLIWDFLSEKDAVVQSIDANIEHIITNTNILLGTLPNIIGGKTGYTDGALGCLVLVVNIPDKNDKIINVILGSDDRFGEMQRLVNWVKLAYRWD